MLKRIKVYGFSIAVTFLSLFFMTQISFAGFACLPSCNILDGRNFIVVGTGQDTLTDNMFIYGLSSPANAPTIEIGIFDGDSLNNWDLGDSNLRVTLFADPLGDGRGAVMLGQWFGDGIGGDNAGDPLPDNDWFNVTMPNGPEAMSQNGNYRYSLVVEAVVILPNASNSFRIRTDGSMILFPDQSFQFEALNIGLEALAAFYPNLTEDIFFEPECSDGALFVCRYEDPGCCLAGGIYDVSWEYFVDVGPAQDVLNIYDGDFDFGSTSR